MSWQSACIVAACTSSIELTCPRTCGEGEEALESVLALRVGIRGQLITWLEICATAGSLGAPHPRHVSAIALCVCMCRPSVRASAPACNGDAPNCAGCSGD